MDDAVEELTTPPLDSGPCKREKKLKNPSF
jgi:hypothetical protein